MKLKNFAELAVFAAQNGVACGPDGVMRPQTTLRLSSVIYLNSDILMKTNYFTGYFYSHNLA